MEPRHTAEELEAAVREHQIPGVRVFAYYGVTGCSDDSATLVIDPPRLVPKLLPEELVSCMVPDFYVFAFAVPAAMVPDPLDLGCEPTPCPRAARRSFRAWREGVTWGEPGQTRRVRPRECPVSAGGLEQGL